METIRKPLYDIIWNSKDVSTKVSDYLLGLAYTDNLHAESDDLDISFEDRDNWWKAGWYPQRGDTITVQIGLSEDGEEKWLKAGIFKIDKITFSGQPDTMSVKGLSSDITEALRQKKTKGWENVNLSQVISELATQNGLQPNIGINPDLKFNRLDQKNKSDLAFIKDLADKYGYNTKIDAARLIFTKPDSLEASAPVLNIERGSADLKRFDLRVKTHEIYKACEVRYWDPKTKKAITHTENAQGIVTGDVLKISERVENLQQAIERAKSELKRKNKFEYSGSLTYMGNPYLVAGANVQLTGFYNLDGKYLIEEARHTLAKNAGYETALQIRKSA